MKKVNWVTKMFSEWHCARNQFPDMEHIFADLDNVFTLTVENLSYALCQFITEICKLDGSDFPGKTLYDIVICIQFYLETYGFNCKLVDGTYFKNIWFTLDNVMKDRCARGIAMLWNKLKSSGLLMKNYFGLMVFWALTILNNFLILYSFMLGLTCTLRTGKEHRSLHSPGFNSQFEYKFNDEGVWYTMYKEDIGLKTNKGSLKHCEVGVKVVPIYPSTNSQRCPVRIFDKYISKLPVNRKCKAFYLQPLVNFRPSVWYRDAPVRVNALQKVVKNICKLGGLNGYYTNYSLRPLLLLKCIRLNVRSKSACESMKCKASKSIIHSPKLVKQACDDYCKKKQHYNDGC